VKTHDDAAKEKSPRACWFVITGYTKDISPSSSSPANNKKVSGVELSPLVVNTMAPVDIAKSVSLRVTYYPTR
jgi:hypothetical protein